MFVSSLSQNNVILKIMIVTFLCVTLFEMVLHCLTYQLLICINFVDSIIETNGQQEKESSG